MPILLQRTLWSATIAISLLSGATPGHCELVSFSPFLFPYDEDAENVFSVPGESVIIDESPNGFFEEEIMVQLGPVATLV